MIIRYDFLSEVNLNIGSSRGLHGRRFLQVVS